MEQLPQGASVNAGSPSHPRADRAAASVARAPLRLHRARTDGLMGALHHGYALDVGPRSCPGPVAQGRVLRRFLRGHGQGSGVRR